MQEPQEGSGGFVVAGGDAAELLEAVKHPLDAVAILVSLEVAGDRDGAIGPRRDNRQDAMEKQALADGITIVAFVRQQHARSGDRQRHQVFDRLIIRDFAAG